jgi:hypothetical protein
MKVPVANNTKYTVAIHQCTDINCLNAELSRDLVAIAIVHKPMLFLMLLLPLSRGIPQARNSNMIDPVFLIWISGVRIGSASIINSIERK